MAVQMTTCTVKNAKMTTELVVNFMFFETLTTEKSATALPFPPNSHHKTVEQPKRSQQNIVTGHHVVHRAGRPIIRLVLSTRVWGVPPAGGPLL